MVFENIFPGLSRSRNFQEKHPGLSGRRGNRVHQRVISVSYESASTTPHSNTMCIIFLDATARPNPVVLKRGHNTVLMTPTEVTTRGLSCQLLILILWRSSRRCSGTSVVQLCSVAVTAGLPRRKPFNGEHRDV